MRATLTSLLFVAVTFVANAQFSITPKLGLEPSNTSINYNDLGCLSPLGTHISPLIGLRMDYKFKKTHGPYLGVATNRPVIALRFNDPETGLTSYTASPGDRQIRIEGGYLFSTKPIFFNKSSAKSNSKQSAKQSSPAKQGCGKYVYRNPCGSKAKNKEPQMAKKQAWNMRIQPSAGVAYNTGSISNINDANYQYNAGNWKTAIIAGTDFEFAKGRDRVFVVGFQYLKAIGDMETQTIVQQVGTKITTTHLTSNTSSWNVTVGVPFTLSKKKSSVSKKKEIREIYKIRESKKQCIYKSPCRKA